jgi:hypothetical protein
MEELLLLLTVLELFLLAECSCCKVALTVCTVLTSWDTCVELWDWYSIDVVDAVAVKLGDGLITENKKIASL